MKIYHIVAVSENQVIGKKNRLPWHFSSDLKHFKELTSGNTVIMGRKTFESIGKPLSGRENYVLSREKRGDRNHLKFFDSLERALGSVKTEKAFIIGGADLYRQTLDKIDGIYLTKIHKSYEGDAYYPEVPESFREKDRKSFKEDDVELEFLYLEKKA